MIILPGIKIEDLALLIDSTLIIADVHIGFEEALNKQGIFVPRIHFEEIVSRVKTILGRLNGQGISRIIINGDLKHEFGTISEQEWRNTLKFLDLLLLQCNEVILIKGNHDSILGPIAKKRNIRILEHFVLTYEFKRPANKSSNKHGKNRILITHGDKIPDENLLKDASTIIIGHEHPAISLKLGARIEQYKCFLKGRYHRANLIVQPSFNTIIEGTDILRDQILSPFLRQNLDNFQVYIIEDKVYDFGKLRGLRKD